MCLGDIPGGGCSAEVAGPEKPKAQAPLMNSLTDGSLACTTCSAFGSHPRNNLRPEYPRDTSLSIDVLGDILRYSRLIVINSCDTVARSEPNSKIFHKGKGPQ